VRFPSDQIACDGRLAWTNPTAGDGGMVAGVHFTELSPTARRWLRAFCLWAVTPGPRGRVVSLQGEFVEGTDFDRLSRRIAHERLVDLDLGDVHYINSNGVTAWLRFLERLSTANYRMVRCSMPFMSQAMMVPGMLGRGVLRSFRAPYRCRGCWREEIRLVQVTLVALTGKKMPHFPCTCGGQLELDDVEEAYQPLWQQMGK